MATLSPPEYVLDDFYRAATVRMADETERILCDRIKLVIKPKPRFLPESLWLKLAAIFLHIEKYQNSTPKIPGDSTQ